jgi:hypothetical protein
MEFSPHDWLDIATALGVLFGLFYTARSYRADAQSRRVTNLIFLTQNHLQLWQDFDDRPNLARVLDASANVATQPVTAAEEGFVRRAIQLFSASYEAMRNDLTVKPENIRSDVASFFSLPIPKAVWLNAKPLLNQDLVAFVESCLKG